MNQAYFIKSTKEQPNADEYFNILRRVGISGIKDVIPTKRATLRNL